MVGFPGVVSFGMSTSSFPNDGDSNQPSAVHRDEYNHRRPHRSLPHRATPATAYTARPKAAPGTTTATHERVRTDKIDKSGVVTLRHHGRLHHIGVGRTHTGTYVLLLVQDLDIRIINAATGELLRELTLDPTRDYQPTGRKPRTQKQ